MKKIYATVTSLLVGLVISNAQYIGHLGIGSIAIVDSSLSVSIQPQRVYIQRDNQEIASKQYKGILFFEDIVPTDVLIINYGPFKNIVIRDFAKYICSQYIRLSIFVIDKSPCYKITYNCPMDLLPGNSTETCSPGLNRIGIVNIIPPKAFLKRASKRKMNFGEWLSKKCR